MSEGPQVSSPLSICHIFCFSTEPVRLPTLQPATPESQNIRTLCCWLLHSCELLSGFYSSESLWILKKMKLSCVCRTFTTDLVRRKDVGTVSVMAPTPEFLESEPLKLGLKYK